MSRRVVSGVCAIGVGMLVLSGCDGFQLTSSNFTDSTDLTQQVGTVRLNTGSGNVIVRTGSTASVRRTVHYRQNDKPGQTHRVEGDTLVLDDCPQRNCSVDYEVTLPAAAKIMGQLGSGEIDITGMSEVGVRTGSGDVRVRDISGPVTATAGSGEIQLTNLQKSAVVEVGSGDIRMTDVKGDVTALSRSGEVTASAISGKASVESGSGDVRVDMATAQNVKVSARSGGITVTVPRGQAYKTNVVTSSGEKTVNVDTSQEAPYLLDLEASSGNIQVDYRG
ncbi:DUF4097 domain-containing protein [Kibdelosporangium philippinense]|uniref:DUF4097 domain-containing protein n=2 Tax=Kibdelosporangium philippinense TaxID=211113 RepID=A0ABS8ZEX0_9PSEU|nr:DUF4097 family beta strand repeat-containing protein [Kibdelosporangium philippinense]MCE7005246.1 DUF4097 domain-containing protein [Kibdelosporangium philippinense]